MDMSLLRPEQLFALQTTAAQLVVGVQPKDMIVFRKNARDKLLENVNAELTDRGVCCICQDRTHIAQQCPLVTRTDEPEGGVIV